MSFEPEPLSTAVVLPFPQRAGVGHVRLARSLAGLSAALDEQRAALALWRSSLSDLRNAVGGLGGSLESYSTGLCDLKDRVGKLHEQTSQSS